jgi:hypothetical protein
MPALRYFDSDPHKTPFLVALDQVRRQAAREGHCFQHVQAIIVAIDQYAEAATGIGSIRSRTTSWST